MMLPSDIFPGHADFDPAADFDAFLKSAPARWVVYLLADADDQPVQLLCVKNLRYSLKRRLGGEEQVGPTRRVNYRDLVRRVYWRRVDSDFEADSVYLEVARALFPKTYQGMTGFRPAWFIHADPEARFPKWTKTIDLSVAGGQLVGPLEDKHSSGKLIEEIVDWFDLCRYYNVLCDAPKGLPCAYKEMGKCPAPCDGSISMEQYRRLVELSIKTVIDPSDAIRDHTRRMQAAAKELRFEVAGKIKQYVDQLSQLGKGPYRHVRRLEDFQFVSLQRGPALGTARVFLITPGTIEEIAGLIDEPKRPGELIRLALELAAERTGSSVDTVGAERIGVVSHHLFQSKQTHGVFLPLESIDEKSIVKAWKELQKQKTAVTNDESEGVVKELQAL